MRLAISRTESGTAYAPPIPIVCTQHAHSMHTHPADIPPTEMFFGSHPSDSAEAKSAVVASMQSWYERTLRSVHRQVWRYA